MTRISRFPTLARVLVACCVALSAAGARGEPTEPDETGASLQLTTVAQRHPRFDAPYSGVNSLTPKGRTEETTDVTAYLGRRLWRGTEVWVNPEVDQGFGFDKTVGVAGFPSGEAYKVGANAPYLRVPRLFVRQTIALGGDDRPIEAGVNQLAGASSTDRLTVTIGKFSVVDVFDGNRYAHDPRGDFLNWSLIDTGTFDYAADAWGFTYGAAAELAMGDWTTRAGLFQLSRVPNGKVVAVDFGQYAVVGELERRQSWWGREGAIRLLGFVNRAPMGRYADATARARLSGDAADIVPVRARGSRAGVSLSIDQPLADDLGVFVRAGVNDGRKEAYEFTEINRTVATGVSLTGARWKRADDVVGVGVVVNGLSKDARAFFAAGGTGILIGDGRLDYGHEKIVEGYYAIHVAKAATLSVDYQHIDRPAYNRDRGPVSVYSVRLHLAN